MTVATREINDAKTLFTELEELALTNHEMAFRGHQSPDWKLDTTYARHRTTPHQSWSSDIDDMLDHFTVLTRSLGPVPYPQMDRRSRLEYARHHGVPTPVIDFSYSPYVAAFFAISGLHLTIGDSSKKGVIIALDYGSLATFWAREVGGDVDRIRREFIYGPANFEHGYPGSHMKFLGQPASWNLRMQRQLGCLLYDTLDYRHLGILKPDLAEYVAQFEEPLSPDGKRHPTLTRFVFPLVIAPQMFERLEMMTITATRLLDHEGLSMDVKNTYNYNRRTSYAWDVIAPDPDDTRMLR